MQGCMLCLTRCDRSSRTHVRQPSTFWLAGDRMGQSVEDSSRSGLVPLAPVPLAPHCSLRSSSVSIVATCLSWFLGVAWLVLSAPCCRRVWSGHHNHDVEGSIHTCEPAPAACARATHAESNKGLASPRTTKPTLCNTIKTTNKPTKPHPNSQRTTLQTCAPNIRPTTHISQHSTPINTRPHQLCPFVLVRCDTPKPGII